MIKQPYSYLSTLMSTVAILALGLFSSSASGHEAPGAPAKNGHEKFVTERFAPSKPMAVVHFVKPARFVVNSGETLNVHLTMMASEDVDSLLVEAKAEAGLVLLRSASHPVGPMKAGEEKTVTFEVTALAEGRRYVNIQASSKNAAGRHMSTYSLPVEVGDTAVRVKTKRASNVVEDDQGNRLILLPAVKPMNDVENP